MLQDRPHFVPDRPALPEKMVERITGEEPRRLSQIEMPRFLQDGKIDNVIAECDADARRAMRRFENTVGKVLQRKMRVARNVDERFKRHILQRRSVRAESNYPTVIDRRYRR